MRWAWLLVLPWVIEVSTSIQPIRSAVMFRGQPAGLPFKCYAENPSSCEEALNDFVDAMNEAHMWREENNHVKFFPQGIWPCLDPNKSHSPCLTVTAGETIDAPLTADEKEFLRKGHLAAIGTPEPQIRTLKATATTE